MPAKVPDHIIAELRGRERNGCIELPKSPRFRVGDPVRIDRGPFKDRLALYAGQSGQERVLVLLELLGAKRQLELAADAVEPAS
jgi:transcription antitermination factor NusG